MRREAIAIAATVLLGACQTPEQREGAGKGAALGALRGLLEPLTMGPAGVMLIPIMVPVSALIGGLEGSGQLPSPRWPAKVMASALSAIALGAYEPLSPVDLQPPPPVPRDADICRAAIDGDDWTQAPQHQALVVEAQRRQLTPQGCRAAFD